MNRFFLWAAVVVLSAAAWGADVVVEGASRGPDIPPSPAYDATLELRWDNGFGSWWYCSDTGADYWIGNDFDISTIKTFGTIKAIKVQLRYDWPNAGWDGVRAGIFAFDRVPGSMMWPTAGGPYFFKPTGQNAWKEIPVAWVLPSGVRSFVAAVEQYYDYPNCDPVFIDSRPTFLGHTWHHMAGKWELFSCRPIAPYRNLMLRVFVANESFNVAPTSVGRVKALYY
jgi:hypothetical protein